MLIVCPHCWTKNRLPNDRITEKPICGRCQAELLPSHPITLGDQTFSHYVHHTQQPIVVDFWADWCAPCRMMAPQFVQAAHHMPAVRFAKVDTENSRQLSAQFAIRSLPTLLLFRGGQEIGRQSGAMRASQIMAWVQQGLG